MIIVSHADDMIKMKTTILQGWQWQIIENDPTLLLESTIAQYIPTTIE